MPLHKMQGHFYVTGHIMIESIPPENVIYTQALTKKFDGSPVVNELSLAVPAGAIFGLLGIYIPDSGDVKVLHQTPQTFRRRERAQIGYMSQQFVLYPTFLYLRLLPFCCNI
jgi:ABC-type multidrug transport system ATPase subunit